MVELKRGRHRLTKQRRVILDLLRDDRSHPDAYEIYAKARARMPRLSIGTVYRTLGILRDLGLVRETKVGNMPARYETQAGDHAHAICVECGTMIDLDVPMVSPERLQGKLGGELGFTCEGVRLEVHGHCQTCRISREG